MNNRKLGFTVLLLSTLFGAMAFGLMVRFTHTATELGCFANPSCSGIESVLNWSHFMIGIVFAAFALGIYLIFFSKSEYLLRKALKRLETEKHRLEQEYSLKIRDEKFNAILKALAPAEKNILTIIKDNEGITQSTLRIKAEMSKAKASQVLSDLLKRGIVKREPKGKTYKLFLSSI